VELLRYGIVAAPIYSSYYKDFIVGEEKTKNKDFLITKLSGKDLNSYGNEESSLYDLLDACKLFINGELAKITVDFARLNELEYLSLDRRYPQKDR